MRELQFEISHSIHDKLTNCGDCKTTGSLFRLVTDFDTIGFESSNRDKKSKPGKIVNEFIRNANRDLNKYKNDITEVVSNVEDVGE